jgi:hypothetical protein
MENKLNGSDPCNVCIRVPRQKISNFKLKNGYAMTKMPEEECIGKKKSELPHDSVQIMMRNNLEMNQ